MRPQRIPTWFLLAFLIAVLANLLASGTTRITIELMRGVSDFANRVRAHDLSLLHLYNLVSYPAVTLVIVTYLWPVLRFFRCGGSAPTPEVVRRRVISAPLFLAVMGFVPWALGTLLFPIATLWSFGTWSPELMSQHVLSPLVNGFLAATTTYFLTDWLFRRMVIPEVFPDGRLSDVEGATVLRVPGRLLVFLVAVAFLPLFTMLGLVQAASQRLQAGIAMTDVVATLIRASQLTFAVYLLFGILLTMLVARTFTRPLRSVAIALRRVRHGDLSAGVRVESGDEVGMLQDGLNSMVGALRRNEEVLQTFGRVVEPAVRDHLLSGDLRPGGEERCATVLFCDLRGFTAMAERSAPDEVVATLNEFFTIMTAWVRHCGGFVNKFIGDALFVVFGLFDRPAPESEARAAAAALRCALGMRQRRDELNRRRRVAGQPPLAFTVGVHSGEVLAGTIGAQDRHEFTVIGDTVNVAARIQELCKERGVDLLISEATRDRAIAGGSDLHTGPPEPAVLRGRREPVRVFAVEHQEPRKADRPGHAGAAGYEEDS